MHNLSSPSSVNRFIDVTFPSFASLSTSPDVMAKLKARKAELEARAQEMRGSGRIASMHSSATHALTQLAQLDTECAAMAQDVRTRLMGEHAEEKEDGKEEDQQKGEAKDEGTRIQVVQELRGYTTQVQQLEQARKYLVLLLKIQDLDSQVQTILARITTSGSVASPSSTATDPAPSTSSSSSSSSSSSATPQSISEGEGVHDALVPFLQLIKVHEVLESATKGPLALKEVLYKKIDTLGHDLVSRAKSAFKSNLHSLGWPSPIAISTSKIDLRTSRTNEPPLRRSTATERHANNPDLQLLARLFCDLLVLQSSLQRRAQGGKGSEGETQKEGGEETLWVMDIMLEPIIKRFRYHFSGKKATNRIDKPEWPLHHAKKIIQEHTAFLSLFIQNLLLEEGSRVDAKTEFVKGLILAINAKFQRDINTILTDKHLLFHTVKELLAFEKHMRAVHAYPVKEDSGEYIPSSPSLPTCMDVLEDENVFHLWLQAEIELGVESLYAHLSAPGAWEVDDSEDHRAAKCAHMLLALLHSFTERFRYLKAPQHQLEFFQSTQHRLLQIFLKEVAVWREWKDWKDWREWWGSTGNTSSARWVEMMEKWCIFANSLLLIRSAIKDWSDQLFFLLLYKMKLEEDENRELDSDTPLVGSIFDDILKQYKSLQRQFVDALITNVSSAFKRATTVYLKRKKIWIGPLDSSDISTELCTGLEELAAGLRRASTGLAPSLFAKVWRGVATTLDSYVVESLLPPSSHAFSFGGAPQFIRDMQALFLLFRPYTSNPESHFRRIKDVIKIITLSLPESKVLLARLEEGRERDVLVQYGISKLDEECSIYICRMRVS